MTNDEALNVVNVMSVCKETGKLGYAIAKNLTKLRAEIAEYSKLRDETLSKYGTPVPGTTQVQVTGENVQKYLDEMGDIPKEEVEFTPYQVAEDVFTSGTLDSSQMAQLIWMVKD